MTRRDSQLPGSGLPPAPLGTRLRQLSDALRTHGSQRASIGFAIVEMLRCLWEGNKGFVELEIADGDWAASHASGAGNLRVVLVPPRAERQSGRHEI